MPESYTHVYLASEALVRSGNTVASRAAFIAGANGPDPLYAYMLRRKQPKYALPQLAAQMHQEKTGAFLLALVDGASTPAQQSYTLGFISHYTTDCTLNPYLDAMSAPGQPYALPNGRWLMAAALDSALYHRDYNTRLVPLHASTPVLINEDLAQVATLLHSAIQQVYGKDVPLLALADAFHHNLALRRRLVAPGIFGRLLLCGMDNPQVAKNAGPLAVRRQPGQKLRRLPQQWANPFSGEKVDLTLDEVVSLARQTGAICITAVMRYWLGELDGEKLRELLGNNAYATGLPCPAETPQQLNAQGEPAPEHRDGFAPEPLAALPAGMAE